MTSVDASTPEIRGSEFTSAAFVDRHVGPDADETARILALLGVESLDDLARRVVPSLILDDPSDNGLSALDAPLTEQEALERLSALASKNTVNRSMIGLGYYGTITPSVIQRNVLENPAWYTAYTPYQAEIAQGRLEALVNFQTMVCDLAALPVANMDEISTRYHVRMRVADKPGVLAQVATEFSTHGVSIAQVRQTEVDVPDAIRKHEEVKRAYLGEQHAVTRHG